MPLYRAPYANMRLGIKSALIAVNLVVLLLSACAARPSYHADDFWGRDKLYHFTASAVIGGSAAAVARNNGAAVSRAPLIGISAAVAAGAGKEWYDLEIKGTFWSWKDLFWDVTGGAVGAYLFMY